MPTYGDIRTTFKDRLKRRDCTDALADGFISDGIKRIQRNIAVPAGEKSVVVTLADDNYFTNGFLAIPSDFIRLKDLTYTCTNSGLHSVLRRAPLAEVLGAIDCGVPGNVIKFCRQLAGWVLGPQPLAGDTVRIDYYSEYASVTQPADESVLLDIADDLVIYAALAYACDHWNDKRGQMFEQRFTQVLSDIQGQSDADELSGDTAVAQAFYFPPDHL
jgi:hypothetical protein